MDGKDTPEAGQGTKREDVEEFWLEHSKAATVEEMMLDSQSTVLDKLERPEVVLHPSLAPLPFPHLSLYLYVCVALNVALVLVMAWSGCCGGGGGGVCFQS